MEMALGLNMNDPGAGYGGGSSGPIPPPGFKFLVLNGKYLTLNGKYLMMAA